MQTSPLNPTIWRTCRALANAMRLQILARIIAEGPLTVKMVMHACALSEPRASQHLRMLQSRGLLSATRESRWVRYAASPDPLVPHAALLLQALENAYRQREPVDAQVLALTALTHPRRVQIVRALNARPMAVSMLIATCRISRPAIYRHLAKLERRGWVACDTGETYVLLRPEHDLARALMAIACSPR